MMKAKKSLGQNWLQSASAVKEIINAAQLKTDETVLEIGPGQGVLTEALLAAGAKVVAIEKDNRLLEPLQNKFATDIKNQRLTLIAGDILELNLTQQSELATLNNYKLVANIPYYLTGQIIRKFLSEEAQQPKRLVLMLQKEVAQRIVATDKKESLLSISVKVYGQPRYVKTVPAGAFKPRPKIDSAILSIADVSRDFFKTVNEDKFFKILKLGFSHKRKLLTNNLQISGEILTACGLPERARAENLGPDDWRCLTKRLTRSANDTD